MTQSASQWGRRKQAAAAAEAPYTPIGTWSQPAGRFRRKNWIAPEAWQNAPGNTIKYADNPYGYFPTSELGQQIIALGGIPQSPGFNDPRSASDADARAEWSARMNTPRMQEARAAFLWGMQHGHIGHRGRNTSFIKQAAPFLMAAGPFLAAAGAFGAGASGAAGAGAAAGGQSVAPTIIEQALEQGLAFGGMSVGPSTLSLTGTLGASAGAGAAAAGAATSSPNIYSGGSAAGGGGAGASGAGAAGAGGILSKLKAGAKILEAAAPTAAGVTAGAGYLQNREMAKDAEAQAAAARAALAAEQAKAEKVLPIADEEAIRRARRRAIQSMQRRRGRAASIMTSGGGDALGG